MAGPAQRGSTQKLATIKEVTFGTTPATPTGLEMPIVDLSPKSTQTEMKSAQIRTHPFVDRILLGRFMHEVDLDVEIQPATHDSLFETFFGSAIAAKTMKILDVLKSVTAESQVGGGSSLFNQFTGLYFSKMSIACSANDTAPVKVALGGTAKAGTLDAGATLYTAVTAAGNVDPYVFGDASLTINAAAKDVVSGTIDFQRQVDPLMVWNSRVPREFIPSDVTCTGTLTVPYDDGAYSTILAGFTDAAQVYRFSANGGATFRQLTLPKTKYLSLGRQIQNRGVVYQAVNWEAYYDSASTTLCTLATE